MGTQYVKTAVAVCLLMSAMIAGTVSFGFFMDPVTTDLGFDRSAFSLYFSLITVVGTCTLPFYGKIISKIGARKMIIVGGIWTGITISALSLCTSLPMFYVVGALVGLGFFGCSYVAAPVIVANWFKEKNGFIMGLAAAIGGVVAMLLSLVFPTVITSIGWQAGYVVLGAAIFVLTTPVGLFLVRSTPAEVGLRPYGDTGEADASAAAAEAAADGVPYAVALKSPQLWVMVLAFILFTGTITITQHLAAYFVSIGYSAVVAGVFMSVISGGIIVTNGLAGVIADKLGLMRTVFICSLLALISFLLLPANSLVGGGTMAIVVICAALILMSIGNTYASLFGPMVTRVAFGSRDYSALWGIVSMACVLGQAIGAPLWGLSYDLTGSYEPGMIVAAIAVAVGFFLLAWAVRSSQAKLAAGAGAGAAGAEPKAGAAARAAHAAE